MSLFTLNRKLHLGKITFFELLSQVVSVIVLIDLANYRATVWALATAACLLSGDYRKAREKTAQLTVA